MGAPPEGQTETGDEYNPYLSRTNPKRVSDFGSWANMVKSAAGTGLFALPNAFAAVGMWIGIGATLFFAICLTIALHMLVRAHYIMCVIDKKPHLTYEDLCDSVLKTGALKGTRCAKCLVILVDVTLFASYIGISSVYVVFISGIVQELADPEKNISQSVYAAMIFPFLLLVNLMRNLKDITPLSIAGNVFVMVAAAIGVVYALKDGPGDTWVGFQPTLRHYPRVIGTIFFSLCSPGLILEIERNMKTPWNYEKPCGVLDWGMIFVVLLYTFVSGIVYSKWGSFSVGNFIRNHPVLDTATIIALVSQVLSIYFTYGLMCYLPALIIQEKYGDASIERSTSKRRTELIWFFSLRLAITVITCLLGALVPRLDIFTGLVGAICLGILGAIIPVILYLVINYGNYGMFKWKLYAASVLLFIGVVSTLCATATYLIDLYNFFAYGV